MGRCRQVGLCVVMVAVALAGAAAAEAADARVEKALTEHGLKYELDSDGDYRVVFAWEEDGRSQLVIIMSGTEMVDDVEIREVRSAGFSSDEALPCSTARMLLSENASFKIGAWETVNIAGQTLAIFTARIRADASPEQLATVARVVGSNADELEKQLLGTDEL